MGHHAAQFGNRSQKAFEGRDGSIGRSEDCDWVLSVSGVSRVHAMIRCLNGIYFIEDRSTNGMLLNGAPLHKGEPSALKQGDRLQIDAFEVSVTLQAPIAATPVQPPSPVDRFATPALPPRGPAPAVDSLDALLDLGFGSSRAIGMSHDDGLIPGLSPRGGIDLDPLSFFDPPSTPPASPAPQASWNHTSSMEDFFRPPITESQRHAQPLPENWDLTMGDFAPKAPAPAAVPASPASMPVVAPAPTAEPASLVGGPMAWPESTPPGHFSVAPSVALPASAPASASAAGGGALSPDMQQMLSIVVDGVMDVLRARAEIKNTFRIPVTIIQRSENNPLKFAPTAEEALQKIMAPPNAAFLSGPAAFDDAFDDIRCHQMAMLAGVRAAFESLLAHFGPDRLEQEVDGSKRSAFGGKAKYWEKYRDNYEKLIKNPDDCFRGLFGDEFARAYEEQLARLKSARRNSARR